MSHNDSSVYQNVSPIRLHQVMAMFESLYPAAQAESWDVPGLQVGDPNDIVTRILVTLDVTEDVLNEAKRFGCDLIFAHHPLVFKPLKNLTPAAASSRLALQAARLGINIFAAHTNLDVSDQSTSTKTFEVLGITEELRKPLVPLPDERCYKVAVTIPNDEAVLDSVRDAMHKAGAGADLLGPYEECAFAYPGIGSFTPLPEANPAIGKIGVREYVHEHRIEMMVRHSRKDELIQAIYDSHPYESPAIDLWDLNHGAIPATNGMGWIGQLVQPLSPREIARQLREGLGNNTLRLASWQPDTPVQTLAVCGGAGSSLIPTVIAKQAQLFITADIGHHVALDALTQGLQLIDAGHYATENPAMDQALHALETKIEEQKLPIQCFRSIINTDPWSATP